MKSLLLALLISVPVLAAPVLNLNVAAEGSKIMIWPDHADPDQFYFAPSAIRLSRGQEGAKFHLTKYRTGCSIGGIGCRSKGMINSLLIADYLDDELHQAQQGVLRLRPRARFSTIPMFDGEVIFSGTTRAFIDRHDCSPRTGQPSDEIPCGLTLNKRGLRTIVPMLNEGKTLVFQFQYRLKGVSQLNTGAYEQATTIYGVAVGLGGEELKGHQDLQ